MGWIGSSPSDAFSRCGEGVGGAERDRTAGLLVANEALSQLSYSPTYLFSLSAREQTGKRQHA
jgi:hypothetical protein